MLHDTVPTNFQIIPSEEFSNKHAETIQISIESKFIILACTLKLYFETELSHQIKLTFFVVALYKSRTPIGVHRLALQFETIFKQQTNMSCLTQ